jgi:hypothetical protein
MKRRLLNLALLLPATISFAITRNVPSQYPTIQAGIDACVDGDTVLVADGTYTGVGNKDIDFSGKAIVVTSANGPEYCIIDCQNSGIGFYFHLHEDSMSVLSNFTITHGNSSAGGAIAVGFSHPTIENCIIIDNEATGFYSVGGGIYYDLGGGSLRNCVFANNQAFAGGGIALSGTDISITYCTIINNSASYGGGISAGKSSLTLEHCTIKDNLSLVDAGGLGLNDNSVYYINFCLITGNRAGRDGGGIKSYNSLNMGNCIINGNIANVNGGGMCFELPFRETLKIINSIIANNIGMGGIYVLFPSPNFIITYNDFHANQGGNFLGNVPPQLGQIVGINRNGDSCDVYHNVLEDPLFVNPGGGDYHLTWANFPIPDSTLSPCIDGGCPDSLKDPDSTIADMGVFYYDQGPVIVTLTADSYPVVIQSPGGSFGYTLQILNRTPNPITTDLWCRVILPGGQTLEPLPGQFTVVLPANSSLIRHRSQAVPARAPAGLYKYICYLGDYPNSPTGSDFIPFTKFGDSGQAGMTILDGFGDWLCTGDPFPEEEVPPLSTDNPNPPLIKGGRGDLFSAHPNPFNASTALSYELQAASFVSLKVYDTTGRPVAILADGFREAGSHSVTFDGSNLPSGIYLYHLQTGQNTASGKLLLLK